MTSSRRLRYVRIEYHYVVQEVRNRNIEVHRIPLEEDPTDGIAKWLDALLFEQFIKQLGLNDPVPAM